MQVAPTPFGEEGLFGGGERYPLELSRALAREVECELVTFGRKPRRWRETGGLRVRMLRAPFRLGHPAHSIAPGLPAAVASADLVHTHHMRAAPSGIAALAANALGRRAVVTDHGLAGGDWASLLPRLFHAFLTVSRYSATQLRAPPERTRVVYGGADPDRFRPDPHDRRQGVLFVGRITPHKGVERLIEALPDGTALRVAGSTGHDPRFPERDYPLLLQRVSAGRDVRFTGPVPDAELPGLYRRARVFALPSVHETCYGRRVEVSELLGLAAIEAMASETPVVASRVGGVAEVVRDGETGFLVEPGDVGELRDRLGTLLADPRLASAMGRRGREVVLERFTWRAVAERCLAAYEDVLAPRGARSAQRFSRGR